MGQRKKNLPGNSPEIMLMMTPHHFFLHKVLLVVYEDGYRLITWKKGYGILINKFYKILKGAKIAFVRIHRKVKTSASPVSPLWSAPFNPSERNLLDIIDEAEKAQ